MARLLAFALALVTVALVPGSAAAAPQVTRGMYGDRYCEYLALRGESPKFTADVWNTYGLNACPDALWRATDAGAVAGELGALGVIMNGPRYWLMDRASVELAPGLGTVRTFSSGLDMRHIASVKVPVVDGMPSRVPYSETTVRRANTFTWSRRYPVHELVAPGGRVYVMQAFAQIVDPKLTVARLPKLAKRLKLPAGWRFRTRTLSRALSLTTNGKAVVVQDELQNTYQLRR